MKQKKNLIVDVKVTPAKYDFEFTTLSIRRYDGQQRVRLLKDTKELFAHLYKSDNDAAFIGSATAAGVAVATFFAFLFGMALPEASAGNWVPTYVMSAIAALSTLSWWLMLRSMWVRRIVQPKHVQLTVKVADSSSTLPLRCDVKSNSSHEETIATLQRVATKHRDMLVDISDTLEELRAIGTKDEEVSDSAKKAIKRLFDIEKHHGASRDDVNNAVTIAREKMSATHSMLDYIEEAL